MDFLSQNGPPAPVMVKTVSLDSMGCLEAQAQNWWMVKGKFATCPYLPTYSGKKPGFGMLRMVSARSATCSLPNCVKKKLQKDPKGVAVLPNSSELFHPMLSYQHPANTTNKNEGKRPCNILQQKISEISESQIASIDPNHLEL